MALIVPAGHVLELVSQALDLDGVRLKVGDLIADPLDADIVNEGRFTFNTLTVDLVICSVHV